MQHRLRVTDAHGMRQDAAAGARPPQDVLKGAAVHVLEHDARLLRRRDHVRALKAHEALERLPQRARRARGVHQDGHVLLHLLAQLLRARARLLLKLPALLGC
jgi:hypothetical protein